MKLPVGVVSTAGVEAVELAASAGLVLDDWQEWWLGEALSERSDGNWCCNETVLVCGRQSGKNMVLAALELAALDLLEEPLIIHSAHEVPTALNHFRLMLSLIESTPDLDRKVQRVSRTNGKESIEMRNGSILQFRARGRNSGRGFTAGRLVFDEAFKIPVESMGALIPTLRAQENTQITYASSAPKHDSAVLQGLIARGRADDPEDMTLFFAEWGNPVGTPLDDVDGWYAATPALGLWVTEERMQAEYRTLVSGGNDLLAAEFAREAVGIGEEPVTSSKTVKLPVAEWAGTVVDVSPEPEPGEISIAYDVSKDGEFSSIAIAGGDILSPYVEVVEHRPGVGWLPARLVELVSRWDPRAVGCNGAGPAGAQVGPVLAAFRDAGVELELRQLTSREYQQACGGFYSDVLENRLQRRAQGPLDLAAGDAAARPLGDAWAWDLRQATVPISPLVSVTIARALLPADVAVDTAPPPILAF